MDRREQLDAILQALRSARRVRCDDWPNGMESVLDRPGLYTFWVDEKGAQDLSRGLGIPVQAGLLYAGQAGAGESGNSLRTRIGDRHLNGTARFSTLRWSLGAALHGVIRLSKESLSLWMREHLEIGAYPFADRILLDDSENEVVQALDPPFNLDGVSRTSLRRKLSDLRKTVKAYRPNF